jgi:hypothetical protein
MVGMGSNQGISGTSEKHLRLAHMDGARSVVSYGWRVLLAFAKSHQTKYVYKMLDHEVLDADDTTGFIFYFSICKPTMIRRILLLCVKCIHTNL